MGLRPACAWRLSRDGALKALCSGCPPRESRCSPALWAAHVSAIRNSRYVVGYLGGVIPSSRRPCAQCRPAFHLSSESLHRRLSARELPLKACSVPASGRSRSRGRFRTASRASALRLLSASSDLGRISHPAVARNASAARPRRAAAAEAQNRGLAWSGGSSHGPPRYRRATGFVGVTLASLFTATLSSELNSSRSPGTRGASAFSWRRTEAFAREEAHYPCSTARFDRALSACGLARPSFCRENTPRLDAERETDGTSTTSRLHRSL